MGRCTAALLCLIAAASPAAAEEARAAPRRIVSLNLCADELVLRLADRDTVASVTFLARDPRASNVADLAKEVPVNRGLAEEIAPLAPDLVVVGAFTTRATTAMLKRLGLPVLELGVPQTLDEAYAQIRTVAARLGVPERGAAMVAQMQAAFARIPQAAGAKPSAVVLRPNGFTAGRGSLADDVLSRAGLDNLAARLSTDRLGQLALEEIVRAAPDFLVVNAADDAPPSLADELLHHPALAPFAQQARAVPLPLRLWTCAGPELAEAAARLAAATHPAARRQDAAGADVVETAAAKRDAAERDAETAATGSAAPTRAVHSVDRRVAARGVAAQEPTRQGLALQKPAPHGPVPHEPVSHEPVPHRPVPQVLAPQSLVQKGPVPQAPDQPAAAP